MINFTPGPSELYFTVFDHMKQAFRDGIPSLAHRSKAFESIFGDATLGLRELLGIPPSFHIAFTGSATEVWERSIQNLVADRSFHLVNGAFSRRFMEISKLLGKETDALVVPEGSGFDAVSIPEDQELIGLTHNETSTGVSLPMTLIKSIRAANPKSLIVVDAVSSLPFVDFDFSEIDACFFSVQKGFGLPPGLGVWIFNERCLAKADTLKASGRSIGTYHSLPSLYTFAKKNQTPETPNVLGIYLLGKVVADFLRRGITTLRRETEYKAAVLYGALDRHDAIEPFVQRPEDRSKTVITVSSPDRIAELTSYLTNQGFLPGEGYGALKQSQLRFANFPAHSKETFEALSDAIERF